MKTMCEEKIRYDFGRNWSDYSEQITKAKVANAKNELFKLVSDLKEREMIDIGCGSGIHALAALQLGVKSITCIDYDLDSISTTRKILKSFSDASKYKVFQSDILSADGPMNKQGKLYDVVYSWGVLHHTGDMWKAIENASKLTKPGGKFVVSLYLKTPFCRFWAWEKRLFSKWRWLRPFIKFPFALILILRLMISERKSPFRILSTYSQKRGMSFIHDVDDWLGGYPYESVESIELIEFMACRGFTLARSFNTNSGWGFFGTGCGEWVFSLSE